MTSAPNFYVDIGPQRHEVAGTAVTVRSNNGDLTVEFDGVNYRVLACVIVWAPDTFIPGKGWVSLLTGVKEPPTYLPANYERVYEAHDLPQEYQGMVERRTAFTRWVSHTFTISHGPGDSLND